MKEDAYNQDEVFKLAKSNLDFMASLAMPESITFGFPPVFQTVWTMFLDYIFKSRDFTKIALGLPRGFGKTTLIKLLILYSIIYTPKKFVLVIASTATLAENIIADVFDMLDEPNIKKVYGDWRLGIEKDTVSVKKFGFRGRNVIVAGLGQGGSVRGLNMKHSRPDLMIFEDIQSREDADSEVVSSGIERWMVGTAMKAKAFDGCLFIFVANMYPTKWSLLRRLKKNPSWIKFIAGGILADGTSLWPELQPVEQLLEEFQSDYNSGHPEIFYAEVLNDENASVNNNIDISKLPVYPYLDDEISVGNFIIIDPSNDKVNSDNVAIGLFNIIEGVPVAKKIINDRLSPSDTVKEAIKLAMESGTGLIAVEAVAYQYSLMHWFNVVLDSLAITSITVVPIYPGRKSKNSRILEMFKSLIASEILLHPDCKDIILAQIISFNALKTNNTDDILDLLTYCIRVIEEFGQFITVYSPLNAGFNEVPEVLELEDTSSF